jgi:hypothetical protein
MKALGGWFLEANPKILGECEWSGAKAEKYFAEFIAERLPQSYDAFCKEGEHKNSPGYTLLRRASRCVPDTIYKHGNGEIWRFKVPGFKSTWQALTETEDRLKFHHLQELQEASIKVRYTEIGASSGVYLRVDWDKPKQIYVGMVEQDLLGRKHTNASHFLIEFVATFSEGVAGLVETATHQYLRQIGEPVRKGGKGLFEVHEGNALELTKAFMRHTFPSLFYNRSKIIT